MWPRVLQSVKFFFQNMFVVPIFWSQPLRLFDQERYISGLNPKDYLCIRKKIIEFFHGPINDRMWWKFLSQFFDRSEYRWDFEKEWKTYKFYPPVKEGSRGVWDVTKIGTPSIPLGRGKINNFLSLPINDLFKPIVSWLLLVEMLILILVHLGIDTHLLSLSVTRSLRLVHLSRVLKLQKIGAKIYLDFLYKMQN